MTLAITEISARRVALISGLGCALALSITVLVLESVYGWTFTLNWLREALSSYARNFHIGSGSWALFGLGVWFGTQLILWVRAARGLRLLGFMLGPLAATWVLATWTLSIMLYGFHVWPVDGSPSRFRYVLDGPMMNKWHEVAGWALASVGLPTAVPPVAFANGSSVHAHGPDILLGVVNEAILACVLGTLVVMGAQFALGFRRFRYGAA